MDTTPLPPGDYVIEIDGRKIPHERAGSRFAESAERPMKKDLVRVGGRIIPFIP
jgi:hypothetical protein